jgi:hypothetical protein
MYSLRPRPIKNVRPRVNGEMYFLPAPPFVPLEGPACPVLSCPVGNRAADPGSRHESGDPAAEQPLSPRQRRRRTASRSLLCPPVTSAPPQRLRDPPSRSRCFYCAGDPPWLAISLLVSSLGSLSALCLIYFPDAAFRPVDWQGLLWLL